MKRIFFLTGLVLIVLSVGLVPVLAQVDCPALAQQALAAADAACTETGRNQVCYGNVQISATPQADAPGFTFQQTGDTVNVADVQELAVSPMNEDTGEWGVALMRLQANIPDTLPGQNVTFLLFGDVVVENAVPREALVLAVTPAEGAFDVRSNPSDDSRTIEAGNADVLMADGRLENGSWLRVQVEVTAESAEGASTTTDPNTGAVAETGIIAGWVKAGSVVVDGDPNNLPVLDPSDTTFVSNFRPMQAFYFRTGLGDAPCAEAPDSGILVQTPEGVASVNLRVNGVDVQLGSTAYLQSQPAGDGRGELTISTLEGAARVRANGETQIASAGTQVRVPMDENNQPAGVPEEAQPYDLTQFQALPVTLLPELIAIADPTTSEVITVGGGDLQLTLTWDNDADMDLSVQEPTGSVIAYYSTTSSTGGELDVDSNFLCERDFFSTENIFWPTGGAPAGTYVAGVNQYTACPNGSSATWTLTVLVGDSVVFTEQGVGGTESVSFTYDPATGVDATSIVIGDSLPGTDFGDLGDLGDFNFNTNGDTLDTLSSPGFSGSIAIGDTVSGTLASGGYDHWTFAGSAGQVITIDLSSGLMDTVAELYDSSGTQLARDDDGGDGTNSLITAFPLPATGSYTIVVRSFGDGGQGDYTLSLTEGGPAAPESSAQGEIAGGQTVTGDISEADRETWTFEGSAGQVVTISAVAPANTSFLDTYLELYDPNGGLVTQDDDGGAEGTNSLISNFMLPSSGTYTILVRGYSDFSTGSYELTLDISG